MGQRFQTDLILDALTLSRGDQILIDSLSLRVTSGNVLWLTGPNGIGKTTLLLACAGLLSPDEGRTRWVKDGQELKPHQALAYAAHNGPERDGLTLGEELAFWQRLAGDPLPFPSRLESVGLQGRAETPVAGLSAGQRRRLSLARLQMSNRAAWLMDEPLAGLDTDGRDLVTQCLSDHISQGGLALIASHQPVPIHTVEARKLVLEPTA